MPDFTRYINLLQGTRSTHGFSRGNTLPLIAVPHGMTHWCPQTRTGNWFFHPDDRKLLAFRATRQPSPWMGDYGQLSFLPQTGPLLADEARASAAFVAEETVYHPCYYKTVLPRYGLSLEFVPTPRAAKLRLRFSPTPQAGGRRLLLWSGEGEDPTTLVSIEGRFLHLVTTRSSGGTPPGFACHYQLRFSTPPLGPASRAGNRWVVELPEREQHLDIDFGVSFISAEQALHTLETEIGGRSLESLATAAAAHWNRFLGVVRVQDPLPSSRLRLLYSCLYRTLLFPRILHEIDPAGRTVHWSPFDGAIHPGVLYTDNGFWDTHRTVYPLYSLLWPKTCGEIIEGWTNAYRYGGWLPNWASPGYRSCMVGTHVEAVAADAIRKHLPGIDAAGLFSAMVKNATVCPGEDATRGRFGLADYLAHGFVPSDRHTHAVSRSLDFASCDAVLAATARHFADHPPAAPGAAPPFSRDDLLRLAAVHHERSGWYRNLFDPGEGRFRGRLADGSWDSRHHEHDWGEPFIEGSSRQCGWAVPHDPHGFIDLVGGPEAMVGRIRRHFEDEPFHTIGSYPQEIHEMTEMATAGWGQYAHSNQPVHHVPFFLGHAGRPDLMARIVQAILTAMYSLEDFPGDEDNGEMSAWFLLGALGLFQMFPGFPDFMGFPGLYSHVVLDGPERDGPLEIIRDSAFAPTSRRRPPRPAATPWKKASRRPSPVAGLWDLPPEAGRWQSELTTPDRPETPLDSLRIPYTVLRGSATLRHRPF